MSDTNGTEYVPLVQDHYQVLMYLLRCTVEGSHTDPGSVVSLIEECVWLTNLLVYKQDSPMQLLQLHLKGDAPHPSEHDIVEAVKDVFDQLVKRREGTA